MGIITFSIDNNIEKLFRRKVSEVYGAGKGTLSKALEEAILLWIKEINKKKEVHTKEFIAKKNNRIVASAKSLKELARKLKEQNISPHEVLIISTPIAKKEFLGLRIKKRNITR